jgi:hypothetical protein
MITMCRHQSILISILLDKVGRVVHNILYLLKDVCWKQTKFFEMLGLPSSK